MGCSALCGGGSSCIGRAGSGAAAGGLQRGAFAANKPLCSASAGSPLVCDFHCDRGFFVAGAFFFRIGPGPTGPVCGLASSSAYGWNCWGML